MEAALPNIYMSIHFCNMKFPIICQKIMQSNIYVSTIIIYSSFYIIIFLAVYIRRNIQPLKSRLFSLIIVSTLCALGLEIFGGIALNILENCQTWNDVINTKILIIFVII